MDRSKQLGEEKVSKLLLKFSIPAIIGMLVNALYNVVDRIFIGNGVGSLGIAGITIGFPVMLMGMAFAMLIAFGANALVSIRLGEKKNEEAELIMGNAATLLVVVSLVISVLGLIFIDSLLILFGATETILPYAKDYMHIILWGNVFMAIGFGMNNFIRAEGNPKIAMYTMLIGAITNIILDYVFIFIFDWGMKGAAFATIISQMITASWVLYYFLSGNSTLKLRRANLRLKLYIVGKIIAIGSAPFAMQMAASLLNVILNNSLSNYGGDTAIAGMGIINSAMMLILMPVFGINQGAQPIIGYNYGAKNFDRVKEALKLAILGATVVVSFGFIITRIFPAEIIAFFNKEDQELIKLGSHALTIFLMFLPMIGFQVVGANYFQAVGKPKQAMFLTLSRQVLLLIPLIIILPKFYGFNGILYAGPLADLGSALLTGTWLLMELKSLDTKHSERSLVPEPVK
ncbi:MAG: multidrug transporter MatE [Peptococcaceae bacterium BICA1-8]|nr:MAG: multidrug transporter MatE [Peptococcaceae bacterium BICA1-8]